METPMETREQLEKKFNARRNELLAIVVFSAINLVLLLLDSDTTFLFSASMPLLSVGFGIGAYEESGVIGMYYAGIFVAILIIAFYFVCWILTKKNGSMLIAALVAFSLDTLIMVLLSFGYMEEGFDVSLLITFAIYAWIIFSLINGVSIHNKLKKLPPVDINQAPEAVYGAPENVTSQPMGENSSVQGLQSGENMPQYEPQNTIPLRRQGDSARVLVSANYNSLEISLLRSKGLSELAVNGQIYNERKGIIEPTLGGYSLTATVNGVNIRGDFNGNMVYICANGQQIGKRFRLF